MKTTFGSTAIWKILGIFIVMGPLAMAIKSYSQTESIGSILTGLIAMLIILSLIVSIYREAKKNIAGK
ncbi:MAG TPA: hypothetical protein VN132_05110 [Bdellovibrio sp.]|nr:hypothetical protein [Bdellovibrio sp.]